MSSPVTRHLRQFPPADSGPAERVLRRIFLRDPACKLHVKADSSKLYCYQVAEGEDYHHRISQGELYLSWGDEKLCFPCAEKRGLLHFEPPRLRERVADPTLHSAEPAAGEYPLIGE
jgi:hypothetical protein